MSDGRWIWLKIARRASLTLALSLLPLSALIAQETQDVAPPGPKQMKLEAEREESHDHAAVLDLKVVYGEGVHLLSQDKPTTFDLHLGARFLEHYRAVA